MSTHSKTPGMTSNGDNSAIVGFSPRKAEIKVGGTIIANEVPNDKDLIKSPGRKHNMLDNMNRTFNVAGFGKNAKVNMWDIMALLYVEKQKVENE